MARTGSSTTTSTTGIYLFQSDRSVIRDNLQSGITTPGDGQPAKACRVNCTAGSAVTMQFRCREIHGTAWVTVPAGEFREFIAFDGQGGETGAIHRIEAQVATAGTGTYSFEITA